MKRLRRTLIILISSIIVLIVLVIVFISPITKYLVEKYDEQYTGREIKMDWAYVNPFTGYIHFDNLRIYESKSDSEFISMDGFNINVAIFKLFKKTYEIEYITLDKLKVMVLQNKKDFNFNDLIIKFAKKKDSLEAPKESVHFNLLRILIKDGLFYYKESQIPVNYHIKKFEFESPGLRWDSDTIQGKFSFLSGVKTGSAKGNFTINMKSLDYRLATVIDKFDLSILEQYLKDISNYGTLRATLDADIKAKGNFTDEELLTAKGMIAINDFHFGKNTSEDFASFEKVVLAITELSPAKKRYFLDSLALTRPYAKYEKYDYLDNIQRMLGKNGSKVKEANADKQTFNLIFEIAKYVRELAKNFFESDYKANRIAIYNGDIRYIDYSLREKFSIGLNPLNFVADSIDKKHKNVCVYFRSGIKPFGNVSTTITMNPRDYEDFNLLIKLDKLPLSMFNPYTITYTSFPIDRGTLSFNAKWDVKNGSINSDNHLLIIDPRTSNRIKNKDAKWIPVPLAMAFVRERGNVIDYKIPITGTLNDPKFKLTDVFWDIFKNVFIKPPTLPYGLQVRSVESEIEKSLALKWETRNSSLTNKQERFVERIVEFLDSNPQANIVIHPKHFTEKEKEYIMFYEAKKKYLLKVYQKNNQSFNKIDSGKVSKMAIKDPAFLKYLNSVVTDSMLFTVQDKCLALLGEDFVNAKYDQLNLARLNTFMKYFKEKGLEKRVRFMPRENTVPFNGFSFYKIDYKGDFPESVREAYKDIDNLDEAPPREKYKKQRKRLRDFFFK